MNYPPGLAECGACGKPCRRRTSEIRVYMGQSVPIMGIGSRADYPEGGQGLYGAS